MPRGIYQRKPVQTAPLAERIERLSIPEPNCGCWLWLGGLSDGYGRLSVTLGGREKKVPAHRASYEEFAGPIQAGYEPDHLCRVRSCVNPEHIEPVSKRVNILRGEGRGAKQARQVNCKRGHSLSGANLYVAPSGRRICRACNVLHARNARARRAAR